MSGRRSRRKGAAFEREVSNLLKQIYPDARRGIGQARSGGEVADVEGTPWWVECKRKKKCSIPAAWRQACEATDGRPCLVVAKDDGGPILVVTDRVEREVLEKTHVILSEESKHSLQTLWNGLTQKDMLWVYSDKHSLAVTSMENFLRANSSE